MTSSRETALKSLRQIVAIPPLREDKPRRNGWGYVSLEQSAGYQRCLGTVQQPVNFTLNARRAKPYLISIEGRDVPIAADGQVSMPPHFFLTWLDPKAGISIDLTHDTRCGTTLALKSGINFAEHARRESQFIANGHVPPSSTGDQTPTLIMRTDGSLVIGKGISTATKDIQKEDPELYKALNEATRRVSSVILEGITNIHPLLPNPPQEIRR